MKKPGYCSRVSFYVSEVDWSADVVGFLRGGLARRFCGALAGFLSVVVGVSNAGAFGTSNADESAVDVMSVGCSAVGGASVTGGLRRAGRAVLGLLSAFAVTVLVGLREVLAAFT
ncbi:hypothetical protein [Hymenobacter radiodurans]|uniref:hypothetical protein n=1 Tax=Hymenobacter radiodurans TaxID=2496028 RepID=UPI0010589048|nr:hypothetical protein [Hymenobacter radiodurans]